MTRRKEKLIPPKVHEIADAENSAGSKDAEINQRPHEEFARDFAVKDVSERDLNFALNWEDALAQESELEIEMEKEFQTAESESWLSQMLQLSWGASPVNPSEENFGRLRVSKNMFEAMKLQDPFEAMHAGQSVTLHMHFNHIMRRASRAKDDQTAAVYYNLALKLGAAYTKTQESLAKLRNKGQQKIIVERVMLDKDGQRSEGHRLTVSGHNVDERLMPPETPTSFSAADPQRANVIPVTETGIAGKRKVVAE